MDDELFLPWAEVAHAVSHYLYAKYRWPADQQFELIDGENGVLVRLLKTDGDEKP